MKHVCGRCGSEFTSKAKCWYHMDFECPKRTLLGTLQDLRCQKPEARRKLLKLEKQGELL